ncbi:MAG: precorrin-8X methylmutase [Spirochaetes bacterium]|nr:precorrin-8X methylmutase [Spirochaetota bacterium]
MILNPAEIEKRSFEIIDQEIEDNIAEENKPYIYRIIHTSADFEYGKITEIHSDAISSGITAIKSGCRIYADTNMIKSGVKKSALEKFGCEIVTSISDEAVAMEAERRGITRSIVGIEKACKDERIKIFAIGNAPTALHALKEMIFNDKVKPALVIGMPVGFVWAAESKEEIKKTGVPYAVTNGRKGGSTIAVAFLNALLYQLMKQSD